MDKKRRFRKKFWALFLALALVISSLPLGIATGFVETAYAATRGTLKQTNLSQYNFKSSKFMEILVANYQRGTTYIGSCSEGGLQMHKFEVGDMLVFCMEHGVVQKDVTLKAVPYEQSDFAAAYKNDGYEYAVDNMFRILMYAPTNESSLSELTNELGFKDSKYYGENGTPTMGSWIAAVQMLVWESQQLMRDEDFNRVDNGLYYQDSWNGNRTTPIKRNHYTTNLTGKPAIDIYNFIASEIKKGTNFDRTIASLQKSKPTAITVPEDATYPLTITLTAGSYAGDYKIVDEKGKEIEGLSLSYNKAAKEYSLTIENSSLLDQVFTVKHNDGLVQRAERYLNGPNGNDYRPYFWEYATTNGHTQGFISGFDDPEEGFLTLKTGAAPVKPELGTCEPPDVDVFPTLYIPIDKQDANPGFDGDVSTPMGDAGLDATYTLERQIAGGGWEVIDVITLDDLGSEHVFQDQPFASLTDLESYMTEEGTVSGCAAHPIYGGENGDEIIGYEHESESREPQKRIWDVTVDYRITEERPDGRYIDPDSYAGVREYNFTYHAETEDTCSYFCEDLPWTEVEYTFDYATTLGAGGSYTESGNAPSDELSYDKETFVNDVFRGDIQIIKSNEKYNPFKDSTLGGSENNISIATYWTVKLEAGSEEGDGYVHLVSADPEVLSGGTHQYTVSRTPGVHNGQNPMVVGSNGTLILKDVPYGTYTVTEVKAEDPMYVLEQFTVTVDEHSGNSGPVNGSGLFAGYNQAGTNAIGSNAAGTGDYFNNRYDVNLRDKVKSNVIKVEKYDSETGKIIYPGEDGKIKVFIRYKGNPDYTDEQNQALYGPNGTEAKGIYNRFLPNAESIDSKSTNYTFELDENGEITIAYELPYGIYEICEWLLPEGYYVGKYNEKGEGSSYDFGYIAENIVKVDPGSDGYSKTDTYSVYDSDGKAITFKDKSEYSFEDLASMVVNSYTFTVTEQEMHVDGNYSQLVTYEGVRSEADGSYEKSDYPYTKYYKVAAIINNSVKGKIEITKKGEKLVGFTEEEKDGYKVLTPVFEVATGIKDTVFGIFAAKDITLFDGSEGPAIFDAATDEKIVIKKEAVSNLSNAVETVKAFFGKLLNPKEFQAANYETGSFDHESGAMLWYMLEREASEGNVKRTIYVTPEQKDTTYQYSYTATDGDFNYLWNVEVAMNNQAGGRNVTKVNITKTTEVALGYTDEIPLSYMSGTVGDTVLSPVESFMKESDPLSWESSSRLESYDRTYIFEADGNVEIYADGTSYEDAKYTYSDNTEVDLAKHTPDRYQVKYYDYYKLTESDLLTEERVTGTHQEVLVPGSDENDDGDFDDPDDIPPTYQDVEDKETKTIFEWENGISLISPAAGGKAIYQDAASGKYYAAAEGYSQAGTYTSLAGLTGFTFIETDEYGDALLDFVVPDGWSLVPFTGDKDKDPHYVIITQTDAETGATVYRVLLSDMINWQKCTPEGNFVKAAVQVYQVKYIQEAGDADGFTLDWDGFKLEAVSSGDAAVTTITKHAPAVLGEYVDLGAGYDYEDLGDAIKFWTIPVTAPIYFESADGIRTQMYYKGGMAHTTITMPESAVDHLYKTPVPSLNFIHVDSEGQTTEKYLDWYSALTPSTPVAEFGTRIGLPEGVSVTAKRHEGTSAGEHTYYTIDIVTNQTEETPLEVTFADEYKMRIYTAKAASGNGVGVIDLFNTYKTTVHTKTELIETITTDENGVAHSSLLPLGEYIVRELTADDNYVNEQEDKNVVLSYKDQFTPVVWEKDEFTNKYFTVEIDFSKVFETAFKSDEYQPPKEGEVVKFGLYAAEKITSKVSASSEVSKKSVNKDTLIDVFTVSYENGGNSLASVKLPEGAYYLKELEAPEKYIMSNLRYNFAVKEDAGDYSDVTDFDFSLDDGITGKFILEEKGHVKTTIRIENRLPMPEILINGASFPLDAAYSDEFIAIDVDSDYTEVFIDTFKGETLDVTLPNGKALKVEPGDNTFDYTVDGVKNTFIPTVTYTGYHAIYEEGWKSVKGEDLTDYSVNFTLTGAGTDKDSLILDVTVNHLASKTVTVKEELIDPARPELGYHEVTTEKGNLSKSGYQIFKHEASFFVKDSLGNNVTPLTYERISDGTASSETLDPAVSNEITLTAKDKILLTTTSGAIVTVSMDKNGIVTASIENMLTSGFADDKNAEAVSTGASSSHLDFAKNVTLGRQDTSSDKLMIKINSDGKDSFAIENDHKPHVVFEKVDAENPLKKLSGARFEIYSAKSIGDWAAEPDALIGEYVTDASGKFSMTLDYGVYYYREVAAPSGYKLNTDFVKFRVIKGEDPFTIVVENEKIPYTPGVPIVPVVPTPGPGQQVFTLEIIKIDGDTGARLAGAEFELYGSSIVGGKLVRDEEPILTMVTGELGLVTAELVKAGTYYYRETMAPAGYACDTSFHTVEVKDAKVITSVTMENYKGKPVIGTQAAGPDGEKEIVAEGYITIIDTVSYSNLTPGLEYILKGTLMNKNTGKALKADGKKVTAETVFIPEEPNGTVTVTFRFDASGIKDLDTVVFEKLYVRNYDEDGGKPKEELVTTHEDIEDEGQTVFLCEKPEEEPEPEGPGKIGKLELTTDDTYDEQEQANVPRTGDDSMLYIQFYLGMMLISLAGLLAILFRFDIRKK